MPSPTSRLSVGSAVKRKDLLILEKNQFELRKIKGKDIEKFSSRNYGIYPLNSFRGDNRLKSSSAEIVSTHTSYWKRK